MAESLTDRRRRCSARGRRGAGAGRWGGAGTAVAAERSGQRAPALRAVPALARGGAHRGLPVSVALPPWRGRRPCPHQRCPHRTFQVTPCLRALQDTSDLRRPPGKPHTRVGGEGTRGWPWHPGRARSAARAVWRPGTPGTSGTPPLRWAIPLADGPPTNSLQGGNMTTTVTPAPGLPARGGPAGARHRPRRGPREASLSARCRRRRRQHRDGDRARRRRQPRPAPPSTLTGPARGASCRSPPAAATAPTAAGCPTSATSTRRASPRCSPCFARSGGTPRSTKASSPRRHRRPALVGPDARRGGPHPGRGKEGLFPGIPQRSVGRSLSVIDGATKEGPRGGLVHVGRTRPQDEVRPLPVERDEPGRLVGLGPCSKSDVSSEDVPLDVRECVRPRGVHFEGQAITRGQRLQVLLALRANALLTATSRRPTDRYSGHVPRPGAALTRGIQPAKARVTPRGLPGRASRARNRAVCSR